MCFAQIAAVNGMLAGVACVMKPGAGTAWGAPFSQGVLVVVALKLAQGAKYPGDGRTLHE